MKEKGYSKVLSSIITDVLNKEGFQYIFDDACGAFIFSLNLNCDIKNITIAITVNDEGYIVFVTTPFGADKNDTKMMTSLMEFVCRANYSMDTGCLEIDCDDGEIGFLNRISCERFTPSEKVIRTSIYRSAVSFIQYSVGITNIIINDYSAKKALKQCETNNDDIGSIVEKLLDADY